MICHNEKAGFVLGLNTLQMNRDHDYPEATDNQLRTFEHIGMFAEPLPAAASAMPRLVDPADPGAPLERRVRSYLHANCAHCHRRGGGGNADLQLLYGLSLEKTATLNIPPLHGDMGADRALLLAPGDPEQSVVYRRMKTTQEGRMPHIGSLEPDQEALALLKNWILGLARLTLEAVKKSGLSQALAKCSLIRKDLGDARLTVPAFFHSFPSAIPNLDRHARGVCLLQRASHKLRQPGRSQKGVGPQSLGGSGTRGVNP